MRPRERRDSGQNDLFKARLDQIVDTDHALAKLGRAMDWRFLEKRFGAVYSDKTGHPPLPTRLIGGGFDPQAHARSLRQRICARAGSRTRTISCSAARVLPAQADLRPLVADALAPADGGGEARGADPGEPCGRHAHRRGQAGWVDSDAKCNPVDSIGSSTKSRVSHSERRPSARFPGDKDGSARRNIEPLQ